MSPKSGSKMITKSTRKPEQRRHDNKDPPSNIVGLKPSKSTDKCNIENRRFSIPYILFYPLRYICFLSFRYDDDIYNKYTPREILVLKYSGVTLPHKSGT